jgi:phenylalanyl-tRNA synthetase beta chain
MSSDDPRLHPVEIMNPISDEQAVMRTSLVPGLIQTAQHNLDHRNEDLKLFELSRVFIPSEEKPLPNEHYHLAGVMAGKRYSYPLYGGDEEVDYTDIKGVVEQTLDLFHLDGEMRYRTENIPPYMDPWRSASISYDGEVIGAVGQVHPEVEKAFDLKRKLFIFELDFDRLYARKRPHPMYKPLPKFPSVIRDMAIVVDESVPVQEPLDLILGQRENLLEAIEVFDVYRSAQFGEGKKSIGYRLVYRASDRSLTDEEVNSIHVQLVEKVLNTYNASLR